MRVLVLSFYYRPDLCAGSFRTTPLVDALQGRALRPNRAGDLVAGVRPLRADIEDRGRRA